MAASPLAVETPLEITRKKIESLIAAKDLRKAVVQCEELELQTASIPFGGEHEHWAKVQLLLLLVLDDVNNARHLWRRLPQSAKTEGSEVAALWDVGKFLWKREMAKAQAALRGREWGAPIAPLVTLLRERLSERQVHLISQAYTSLPLELAAAMLGHSVEDAEQVCIKQGWEIQEGNPRMVRPTPPERKEHVLSTTTPDYLQMMARHITFLERQNLG